ncbi:hypothetical protein CRYUN_Cryun24cG0003600 [Craigia yunnanensis]
MGQCASRAAAAGERKNWDDSRLSRVSPERLQGCLAMAKEQRSRFYIAKRCLVMLLCWHKYGKS